MSERYFGSVCVASSACVALVISLCFPGADIARDWIVYLFALIFPLVFWWEAIR